MYNDSINELTTCQVNKNDTDYYDHYEIFLHKQLPKLYEQLVNDFINRECESLQKREVKRFKKNKK